MALIPQSASGVSMDEGHFSLSGTLHLSCTSCGMKTKFGRV